MAKTSDKQIKDVLEQPLKVCLCMKLPINQVVSVGSITVTYCEGLDISDLTYPALWSN